MGSSSFLTLVIFSLVVSHLLLVGIAYTLFHSGFNRIDSGYSSCAVGFSAVLFALKYVLNHGSPSQSSIMGITLPTKYAAWAELILVSIMTPQASFIGHLSGILAGILYVHGYKAVENAFNDRTHSNQYTYAHGVAGHGHETGVEYAGGSNNRSSIAGMRNHSNHHPDSPQHYSDDYDGTTPYAAGARGYSPTSDRSTRVPGTTETEQMRKARAEKLSSTWRTGRR